MNLDDLLRPEQQQQFHRLCIPTTHEELLELPDVVQMHLDGVTDEQRPATDIETAQAIASSLSKLLADEELMEGLDDEERSLVRGAVEYFLLTDDAAGDLDDPLGFDDDARVANWVFERLERPELVVVLD